MKMKLLRNEEKRVNAFIDGDEDAIDYNDDDPEMKKFTKQIQLFIWWRKSRWRKEWSRSSRCWNQYRNRTRWRGVIVGSSEEDDEEEDSEDEEEDYKKEAGQKS